MKILVDENIPLMTVAELRSMGHDVRDIRRTRLEGLDDAELWNMANTERRILVTTDKGFSQHRDERHSGVLIWFTSRSRIAI